jgi:hypothetical protein
MALSLTGNAETAKKTAVKAFKSVLKSYHTDDAGSTETRNQLYRNLLKNIGFFTVNKNDLNMKGTVNSVKHGLGLFDKKVFVLKYEFGCSINDIVFILGAGSGKIKKSLIKSARKAAKLIEDSENEM